MNVFKLLVTGLIAVAFLYIVFTTIAPLFADKTPLQAHVEPLLVNAQARLGEAQVLSLNLKKDQSLRASNFDTPLRSVAFACNSSSECCPTPTNCPNAIVASPTNLIVNESVRATLSVRCDPKIGLQACKIYVGKVPAQLEWKSTDIPTQLDLSTGSTIIAKGSLLNSGELASETITLTLTVKEKRFSEGKEQVVTVTEAEQTLPPIPAGKNTAVELRVDITEAGEYTIELMAQGEDAGAAKKEGIIHVTGFTASTCHATTSSIGGFLDEETGMCSKEKFCEGCDFAFECRDAWIAKGGVTGTTYDSTRGSNTVVYAIYSPTGEGICR
ncbi:MAG: hypothetical protein IPJ89_04765 [Candidatus Iainarchaeum archaeon]|uniref:Uncharacterized protein n=1 Tax=Candidatus Iainarchaeum sp. TaxID=3101447 RepID=A0A7T9I1I0_9ARCH|nr:MAG: hypothetical protein IPJ89_04765 [Candidatus Diapherotrites archaeon]